MKHSRFLPALALFASLGAHPAAAQGLAYILGDEASSNSDFGRSVGDAGDVDGDGVPDVIVGAPFHITGGITKGAVFLYSGRTGNLIWSRSGDFAGDAFGWSVDGVGDIDGDGLSEVIVGAPLWDNNGQWMGGSGKVYLLRGSGLGLVATSSQNQLNAHLGGLVRGLGDITGDGIGDYAFGSDKSDSNGLVDNGSIAFYSGANTQFLFSRHGESNGDHFGYSLDVVRATGSQATSRLIVGVPRYDGAGVDRGQVRLLDGFGTLISAFVGSTNNEWLGAAVAGIGDANNDGWEDYAMGAPYIDILGVGADAGVVRVYSGATTSQMAVAIGATAGAFFGSSLAGFGDLNGDGRDDVLVGAPSDSQAATDAGEVRVISGFTGSTLASWSGGLNDHAGRSVRAAGDLNQDGIGDLIWGANDAPFGRGQAQVHLSNAPAPTIYCTAKVNSQGCLPEISSTGVASLSVANNFHIYASNVINQKFGLLFWGTGSASSPFQGGTLCVQGPIQRRGVQNSGGSAAGSDCSGSFDDHFIALYMVSEGLVAGDRVHAQYWYRDPASSFSVGLTNALAFDILP